MMKSLRSTTAAIVFLTSAALGGAAHAGGVPVFDATAVAQFLESYQTQLEQLQNGLDQLDTMRQELLTAQEQLVSITGAREISGILNSIDEIEQRVAAVSIDSMRDAALSGAGLDGLDRMNGTFARLRDNFDLEGLDDILTSTEPIDRAIAEQASAGMTAIATAEDTYQRANGAMDRINTMINRIDGNPDLKASIDYNARVMAELAVLLSENLRIQAANANVAGATALSEARDSAAQRQFMVVGDGN